MNYLKILEEKRNALLDEMDAIVKKAETETRAFTDDEQKSYDEKALELRKLAANIRSVKEARSLDGKEPLKNPDSSEEIETRAFENYIRGVETRDDTNLTKSDNGAVIPTSIANKIISKVVEICPIYQLANKYNVGGTLSIPYYDESTQAITMAYATEFTDLESTSGKFTSIQLTGFLAGALTKVSKSLINNSQFDIVSYTINAMARSIAQWLEKELLKGTSSKVAGLSGVTQTVTTASATSITADELIELQETVPDVYQSGAVWIMSKATRTAIRKLKDGDGNYLLNKDATSAWGYTLFGKPVYVSDNMDNIAAGKTTVFYGDMSGLAVKLSENVNIEILREKFATQHAVGIVGWIEIDSKVEDAQKIAKLVQKAS